MRGEEVVGQHFPVGEGEEIQLLAGIKAQLRAELFELAGAIRHDDVQARIRLHRFGKGERRGTTVKLVPAQGRAVGRRDRGTEQ